MKVSRRGKDVGAAEPRLVVGSGQPLAELLAFLHRGSRRIDLHQLVRRGRSGGGPAVDVVRHDEHALEGVEVGVERPAVAAYRRVHARIGERAFGSGVRLQ